MKERKEKNDLELQQILILITQRSCKINERKWLFSHAVNFRLETIILKLRHF